MASEQSIILSDVHSPKENAIDAFTAILPTIKEEIIKSRRNWDKHEPKMWSRAIGVSDEDLTAFDISRDLVQIRSASTSYGHIIFGKIRIPVIKDEVGEGFVHVRIHDPPNRGIDDVIFHSLFTDEGGRDSQGLPTTWCAIQTSKTPLEFFNE